MHLPHRDDFDMDTIKRIEDEVRKKYGKDNMKVVFPGDMGNIPPHLKAQMDAMQARLDKSMILGQCFSCETRMENYPDIINDGPDAMPEDWYPAKGWSSLNNVSTGEVEAWLCKECGAGQTGAIGIGIPFDTDPEE